jgi:ATP-dependent DNA helicase RecQ
VQLAQTLQKHFGYNSFRPLQEEIMQSVLNNNDTLALLPTGGGKSLCYQLPVLHTDGFCIVITPLIALMKDQVENLKAKGISAYAIYSGMSSRQIDYTLNNCVYSSPKFLYVSPERLLTPIFMERVKDMPVSLIAVDEAHCISQWGYDFRPSYLKINKFRELVPKIPIIALTATATKIVQKDIIDKLQLSANGVFKGSYLRENIKIEVKHSTAKINDIQKHIKRLGKNGIIYCATRKQCEFVSSELNKGKISTDYYHAGLDQKVRIKKQENWKSGKNPIIVCTNAFGMGIDKGDVNFVIHYSPPASIEAYYQEAGRAGRDGQDSIALLLYTTSDLEAIEKNAKQKVPEMHDLKVIYSSLCSLLQVELGAGQDLIYPLSLSKLAERSKLNAVLCYNGLKLLDQLEIIKLSESFSESSTIQIVQSSEQVFSAGLKPTQLEIIQIISRSYGGVFSDPVKIEEEVLAKRAKIETKPFIAHLKTLEQLGIINYIQKIEGQTVSFINAREKFDHLPLDTKFINNQRAKAISQAESLIHFVTNTKTCRAKVILNYFGEELNENCNNCDFCLSKKVSNLPSFTECLELVKSYESTPIKLKEYLDLASEKERSQLIKAYRWLLDNNQITNYLN